MEGESAGFGLSPELMEDIIGTVPDVGALLRRVDKTPTGTCDGGADGEVEVKEDKDPLTSPPALVSQNPPNLCPG